MLSDRSSSSSGELEARDEYDQQPQEQPQDAQGGQTEMGQVGNEFYTIDIDILPEYIPDHTIDHIPDHIASE